MVIDQIIPRGAIAPKVGVLISVALFILLVLSNRHLLSIDLIPTGDQANDILQTQRSEHGWLLTGHYCFMGVNHPGPFFLYVRLLGQWLAGTMTGSIFGAQLVGVMGCSAAFTGLLSVLLHRLIQSEGRMESDRVAAVLVTIVIVVLSLSHYNRFVTFFIPFQLPLPFLTFLTAAVLLSRGSTVGLVAATFCGAVLVHGYIPMPIIVGPLWLIAVIMGWRHRIANTGCGFSKGAWILVGAIVAIFGLPLIADVLLNPPGNIVNILNVAAQSQLLIPRPSTYDLCIFIIHMMTYIIKPFILFVFFGLIFSFFAKKYFRIWRHMIIIFVICLIFSAISFSGSPVPLKEYSGQFLIAAALLPIVLGVLIVTLELGRRHWTIAPLIACASLASFAAVGSLALPIDPELGKEVRVFARAIAAENPPGSWVKLDNPPGDDLVYDNPLASVVRINYIASCHNAYDELTYAVIWDFILPSLLLDLDHFGIYSCFRDPEYTLMYTPARICPSALPAGIRSYRLEPVIPCNQNQDEPLPDKVGLGITLPAKEFPDGCVRLVPILSYNTKAQ